jgi:predicted nucleic acid-binding protein
VILYLDTSSLVKLYVSEEHSDLVRAEVNQASIVATSVLTYPEARSAFARQNRGGTLSDQEHKRVKLSFEHDWPHYLSLQVTEEIWRSAGGIAETYSLRSLDSIHLATYLTLVAEQPKSQLRFSSFDQRLSRAAATAAPGHRRLPG